MPTITFIDPITGEGAPSGELQYDPKKSLKGVPDAPGVYIWGMKVKVNGKDYFAPWCVGEGQLRTRLFDHYNRMTGSSNEELFDFSAASFSRADIQRLYHSMCVYDAIVNHAPKKRRGHHASVKLPRAVVVPDLIFWNDRHFIPLRFGQTPAGPSGIGCDSSFAIQQLRSIGTPYAQQAIRRIQQCKQNFTCGFHFLYWEHPETWFLTKDAKSAFGDLKQLLASNKENDQRIASARKRAFKPATEAFEYATKDALKSIGIFTTAEAKLENGKNGGYPAVTIELPTQTDFVHDLWSPQGTRRIRLNAK